MLLWPVALGCAGDVDAPAADGRRLTDVAGFYEGAENLAREVEERSGRRVRIAWTTLEAHFEKLHADAESAASRAVAAVAAGARAAAAPRRTL